LLSEESPKSLKLSGFYKLSSGTSTYLGILLNKCKRRLRKYFGLETLPFIDKVYGKNLRLQKGTFCLSLKLLLLSSPEEKLWFSALARAKRLRPLWFIFLHEE
jgi:hypothetical protein